MIQRECHNTPRPILCRAACCLVLAVRTAAADGSGTGPDQPPRPSRDSLPPVVVTGSDSPLPLVDAPVRMEVIGAESIAATRSPRLADAVEWATGLRVESNCQNCNTSEIRMLGLQQRYVSILTDGLQSFSSLAGVYGIEQIPMATIDRIEIVKGGGSTLHGPGAVAGVVNIVPRDPRLRRFTFEANTAVMEGHRSGSAPNLDVGGVWEFVPERGDWGVLLHGVHGSTQAVDVDDDGFTEVARRRLDAGGLRFVARPFPESRLVLDYSRASEGRRGGEAGEGLDVPPNEALLAEAIDTVRDTGTVQFRSEAGERTAFQAGVTASATGRDSHYGGIAALGYAPPGSPGHDPGVTARLAARRPGIAPALADPAGPFFNPAWTPGLGFGRTDNLLVMSEAVASTRIGDSHRLGYGAQWRHETIEDRQEGLGRAVGATYDNVGVFLQDEWSPDERWSLMAGTRLDRHSEIANPILSPRGALRYSPSKSLDWRLAVSTGFRAPEVFDEDLHIANVGGALEVVRLARDLAQESSVTVTFGPDWRFGEGGRWRLDGNLFHTGLRDVFFIDPGSDDPATPDVIESTKGNRGAAQVFGVELNLGARFGDFLGQIGYVEQRSRYGEDQLLIGTVGDPVDNPVFSRDFERTPERYGVGRITYDDGRWSAFLGGKLTGPMAVPHNLNDAQTGQRLRNVLSESPWFFAVDIGLGRTWTPTGRMRLTASAGVRNLFNTFQDDLDAGPFRDPAYVYGPRFPRTPYLGLKLEF